MPRPRIAMRKIRDVLRLSRTEGLSPRQIARSLSLPRITVRRYLERATLAELPWPLSAEMDDQELEKRLYGPPPPPSVTRPLPDWPEIHRELRNKDVTLMLLWLEYKAKFPTDGYQYSQFCRRYRDWQRTLDLVMRQEHRAGEKLFVDFAGRTIPVIDPSTGEVRPAELFVAVLGASNYLYAEACFSQAIPDWIAAHVHCFEFLGCVPKLLVCDNLKSGVTTSHRYEPQLNRSYQEMAAHNGVAVMPARAYKPRDKAYASDCTSFVRSTAKASLVMRHPVERQPLRASLVASDSCRRLWRSLGRTTSCLDGARAWYGSQCHTTGKRGAA